MRPARRPSSRVAFPAASPGLTPPAFLLPSGRSGRGARAGDAFWAISSPNVPARQGKGSACRPSDREGDRLRLSARRPGPRAASPRARPGLTPPGYYGKGSACRPSDRERDRLRLSARRPGPRAASSRARPGLTPPGYYGKGSACRPSDRERDRLRLSARRPGPRAASSRARPGLTASGFSRHPGLRSGASARAARAFGASFGMRETNLRLGGARAAGASGAIASLNLPARSGKPVSSPFPAAFQPVLFPPFQGDDRPSPCAAAAPRRPRPETAPSLPGQPAR